MTDTENLDNTADGGLLQPRLVRLAFDALSDDIADRRGLKWEWEKVDDDVMQGEIRPAWEAIIASVLQKWEPIETAPKDGMLVVLWDRRENFRPYVGSWKEGWKRDSDGVGDFYPTHWLSLPNAEVIAQIPEELIERTVAFSTRGPADAAEMNRESKALKAGFHVAETTLYGLDVQAMASADTQTPKSDGTP